MTSKSLIYEDAVQAFLDQFEDKRAIPAQETEE